MLSSTICGNRRDGSHRIEGEAVARMHLETGSAGEARGQLNALELARDARSVALQRALAVGAGVQLDDVGADALRGFDCGCVRLDEQRDAHACTLEVADDALKARPAPCNVETAFGRAFLASLGNETAGVRQMPQGNGEHFVGRCHLEIERARQLALKAGDVFVGDVTAVLPQVCGDAVGARFDGKVRGAQGIGMPSTPRIADGGDVVDVDA